MRHLLFYLYPKLGSCWRWHLERLRSYSSVFTGRRVIVVAFDEATDKAEDVEKELASLQATVVSVRNDPSMAESAYLGAGIDQFAQDSGNLFYAHAKGVTHTWYLQNVLAWADAMYYLNLTDPTFIDGLLERYKTVGAFRLHQWHGGAHWHYSGSFFWLRLDAARKASVMPAKPDRYSVEGFPGRVAELNDSFCLTSPGIMKNFYLEKVSIDSCREWLDLVRASESGG